MSRSTAAYDFDLTGNTVGLSNASGSYVNHYVYRPFGETTTILATVANRFTFVGQFGVTQEAGGLSAMRARSYSAQTGQFVSVDPIGLAGGQTNLRRYVSNDPINVIDPSGLCDVCGIDTVGTKKGQINLVLVPHGEVLPNGDIVFGPQPTTLRPNCVPPGQGGTIDPGVNPEPVQEPVEPPIDGANGRIVHNYLLEVSGRKRSTRSRPSPAGRS